MTSAHSSIPRLSEDDAVALAREHYGLEVRARPLPSYADQNFLTEDARMCRRVLKIAHAGEKRTALDFEHRVLERLAARVGRAVFPQVVPAASGAEIVTARGASGERHLVRLVTWVRGTALADFAPYPPEILASLGDLLGRIDRALADFSHPAMRRHLVWDLQNATETIGARVAEIAEPARRALVERFLARLEARLPPLAPHLRRSVIHNDANEHNVLVSRVRGGVRKVVGLIDFGDMVYSYTAGELAVAAAYAMLGQGEPLAAAAEIVAGYHAVHPLDEAEIAALFDLICARLATSVCMSAHRKRLDPGNEYVAVSEKPAWALFEQLGEVSPGLAFDVFRQACGMSSVVSSRDLSRDEVLARRGRYVAPSLSLSYRRPLKIVRGFMQYLYDDTGRAYLDGVNNVCHVGHCHPRVVRAARDQMAVLNTNTRYLHDHLVRYAERLAATLPEPLGVCFFVCSGSEANDLALRLARTHTGASDVIVVDGAYHGNLSSLVELSPYKFDGPGGMGAPPHVHKVAMPDGYRGPYKAADPAAGRRYARHVAEAIAEARAAGRRIAAFFCEPMLGCGGQVVLPDGYLAAAARHVRAAGGVVVADEVQVGFGRVGSHFWAFETQGVVPDIVTLGKPIGNGHPMAAVVTTPEIAASFDNGMEYFNTFGGNPVSCAVGLAVLDVIADEGLQTHARRVGARLLAGLEELKEKHDLIGDVRGRGLFLGIELVRDRETLEPAAEEASAVVESMKDEGILLSTDGPLHNVIKIKPPLVFTAADADRLVATLDAVLATERPAERIHSPPDGEN